MPGVPKAKQGKDQQVEQTPCSLSPNEELLGSVASSHMRERARSLLRNVLFYIYLELPANVAESNGRQQVLLICWCSGFTSVQNAHLDQG